MTRLFSFFCGYAEKNIGSTPDRPSVSGSYDSVSHLVHSSGGFSS